jgi:hypothetical protein
MQHDMGLLSPSIGYHANVHGYQCKSALASMQACMGMGASLHGHGCKPAWAWVQACMDMGASLHSPQCKPAWASMQACLALLFVMSFGGGVQAPTLNSPFFPNKNPDIFG